MLRRRALICRRNQESLSFESSEESSSKTSNLYATKEGPDLPEEPGVFALDGVGLVVVRHQQVGHREQGRVPGGEGGMIKRKSM